MTRLFRVIVPVADIEEAQRFYSVLLGEEGERVSPERHYFDCEGTILACFDPTMFNEKPTAAANPEHIYLAVDNLEDMFSRCSDAGAKIVEDIGDRPWGETSFYVEDPFGNPLCFVARETLFTGKKGRRLGAR